MGKIHSHRSIVTTPSHTAFTYCAVTNNAQPIIDARVASTSGSLHHYPGMRGVTDDVHSLYYSGLLPHVLGHAWTESRSLNIL